LVFGTTARRGQNGLLNPRQAAELACREVTRGQRFSIVLGNEKTGLSTADLKRCTHRIRIPMAADQPSINLAQSAQLLAYEWFSTGLAQRTQEAIDRGRTDPESELLDDETDE
jgi:tRNA C32,U32 (ribose-2'-O)-methylase TrmJ